MGNVSYGSTKIEISASNEIPPKKVLHQKLGVVMQPTYAKFQDKQACCAGLRRRPFTAEALPIGKIHSFSKLSVTCEPLMRFRCPSGFRIS